MTTTLGPFEAHDDGQLVLRSLVNLAIARQAEFEDGAQRVYVHLLSDLNPAVVERACHALALRPRADYTTAMPSAADVRLAVQEVLQQDALDREFALRAPMPVDDEDGPRFFCLNCRDESSAWRPFWCPGTGKARTFNRPAHAEGSMVECGKRTDHAGHRYVARCECYETNPVIAERRKREIRRKAGKDAR